MNKTLNCIALTLVIIGALNCGLIGFFDVNIVRMIFGSWVWLERVIYGLVGISGLYAFTFYMSVNHDM